MLACENHFLLVLCGIFRSLLAGPDLEMEHEEKKDRCPELVLHDVRVC
jgi:hypothetical protein